jgi:dUTPase
MPLHKFGTKPPRREEVRTQPISVFWKVLSYVTHQPKRLLGGVKFEIFAQNVIAIQPKATNTLTLGLGVEMTVGVCLISLRQSIKELKCGLQNKVVSDDVVNDIIVSIQNNSDSVVTINAGDSLCYVNYLR